MNDEPTGGRMQWFERNGAKILAVLLGVSGIGVTWTGLSAREVLLEIRDDVELLDDRVDQHDLDLQAIKSSRFTVTNGTELWREIAKIREAIAAMPRQDTPPEWFRAYEQRLDTRLDELSDRVTRIEAEGWRRSP